MVLSHPCNHCTNEDLERPRLYIRSRNRRALKGVDRRTSLCMQFTLASSRRGRRIRKHTYSISQVVVLFKYLPLLHRGSPGSEIKLSKRSSHSLRRRGGRKAGTRVTYFSMPAAFGNVAYPELPGHEI